MTDALPPTQRDDYNHSGERSQVGLPNQLVLDADLDELFGPESEDERWQRPPSPHPASVNSIQISTRPSVPMHLDGN